jgi:hypothetical protein
MAVGVVVGAEVGVVVVARVGAGVGVTVGTGVGVAVGGTSMSVGLGVPHATKISITNVKPVIGGNNLV